VLDENLRSVIFSEEAPPDRKKDESKWTTLKGHVKLKVLEVL